VSQAGYGPAFDTNVQHRLEEFSGHHAEIHEWPLTQPILQCTL